MYKLFFNGHIHTLDEDMPFVTALLVHGDRYAYCGDDNEINLPQHLVHRIDLRGGHVYPGFTDCHTHIATVALNKERIRLDQCQTMMQALQKIQDHIQHFPAGSWILGGGWNANLWPDGKPDKLVLDQITTAHPIVLYNKDGHTQWMNSKALNLCHFNDETADPPGGRLGRDARNKLNGLVFEKACDIVNSYAEKTGLEQLRRCMEMLYPDLYALGITSVHSCESLEIWSGFQNLLFENALKIRICMHPPIENADKFINARLCSGYGNEWLRIGGFKYFVDGSLGSQTAEMFDNFELLDHAGIEVLTESTLSDQLQYAVENRFSATVHAIGDKANHKTLNAIERVSNLTLRYGLRHRIEHAQIIRDYDLGRFVQLNVTASMQPLHIADDVRIADKYLGKRSKFAYRIGSLLRSGARIVFGSDMPIADPDPLKGIRAALTRRYLLDLNEPKWHEYECIEIPAALRAYTSEAAYVSYEEQIKGTIEVGKLADFVVLSDDLEKANELTLSDIVVKMTVLGGETVYRSE